MKAAMPWQILALRFGKLEFSNTLILLSSRLDLESSLNGQAIF